MLCSKCDRKATRRGWCKNHYEQQRNRIGWTTQLVDAEPVRVHIAALKAAGIGSRRIHELSGVSRTTLTALTNGRRCKGLGPSTHVWADTADKLLSIPVETTAAYGANINSIGTVRRLQALVAIGHSQQSLCEHLGWMPSNATRLFTGKQTSCTVATAAKVRVLFNELHLTPGTSKRARNRAAELRWAPPLAWDEDTIDNPNAKPDRGDRRTIGWDERYLELRDLGFKDVDIAAKWGIQLHSLIRQLERYGIPQSPELKRLMHERMCG